MQLAPHKIKFIEASLKADALKFGEFKLKSGRISPYFFKADCFNSGELLLEAGNAYAATILTNNIICDTLYGPAYKGISLATVATTCLTQSGYPDVRVSSKRKEIKDHGDGGMIIGAIPSMNTAVIDDVITSGDSVEEAIDFIRSEEISPEGKIIKPKGDVSSVIILVNRQEKGNDSDLSAAQKIEQKYGIKVYAAINVQDILEYTENTQKFREYAPKIRAYRAKYGVAA
jgi:orotate phosphoribosyltransferase